MKSSKERYDDYKGTGYLFIPFGIIGATITILDYFDIITKFNFITSLFQFCVSIILYVIFTAIGIHSLLTAHSIKGNISVEEENTNQINAFLAQHLTDEFIEKIKMSSPTTSNSDADIYYSVVEMMTNEVKSNFPTAKDELISELVENYYNDNF